MCVCVCVCVCPQNSKLKSRYQVGLEKLASSDQQVEGMQQELRALQPQLVKTVGEVEVLMANIAKEKKEVVEPKAAIVKVRHVSKPQCCALHLSYLATTTPAATVKATKELLRWGVAVC